ncbi:MAG: alpha/beta fold hydrolase [Leptospiraceae bacterium]|nr:alpha/beta fold hydrolase [Leptospiraceae bacterium]
MKDFKPDFLFRSSFIQSYLASSGKRLWKPDTSNYFLIVANGVKFSGYCDYTDKPSRGTIVFIHGWEGSANSSYSMRGSRYFLNLGFDVIRLNLRDHGDSHSFNIEPFHGCRLEETYELIKKLTSDSKKPFHLIGFSLGGSYVSRLALKASQKNGLKNVSSYFAISPSIQPKKATARIEENPIYRFYFLKSWKKSLDLKKKFFPDYYDEKDWKNAKSVMSLTEKLVTKYGGFASLDSYFNGYAIDNKDFKKLKRNLYILISKDDPIIPHEDFEKLEPNSFLEITSTNYGGHNGFLQNVFNPPKFLDWVYERILRLHF